MGIFDFVTDTVGDLVSNPIGKTIEIATQPVRDGLDILDGLSEGELRLEAAARLGADVVSGMALGEIIEYLKND